LHYKSIEYIYKYPTWEGDLSGLYAKCDIDTFTPCIPLFMRRGVNL